MTTPPNPPAPASPSDHVRVRAKTVENGPLQVKGPIELVDHDGNTYDLQGRTTVFLCRCGGSTTKPFCDGTHSRKGFDAAERAVAEEVGATDPGVGQPSPDR